MITNLRERRERIIEAVVASFMETGEPVSSAFVAVQCGLSLSPASIRAIMKELEEEGYLAQPYTSAGRVPTVKCYRYYVKNLMPEIDLDDSELQALRKVAQEAMRENDASLFMSHMATVLSEVTELIGVTVSPNFNQGIFDRLEIVNLGGHRYLLVISLKSGFVDTIHVTLYHVVPRRKIDETARLLTNRLHGLTISEIKKSIGRRLKGTVGGDRKLVEVFLTNSDHIFSFPENNTVHVAGLSRALTHPDFKPVDHSLKLADMFEHKNEIAKVLMKAAIDEEHVSIHIGGRGQWGSHPPLSLVSAMYKSGSAAGFVGVVGPARVHYPKLTAIVRYATTISTQFFSSC